jgi:hypothetical protein
MFILWRIFIIGGLIMLIDNVGKEARKILKEGLRSINNIEIKTRSIKGYIEPKNCEIVFNQGTLPEKIKAISQVKEYLLSFNSMRFERG